MVYHRSDSAGASSTDVPARRHSESSRGSARDEEERPNKEDSKHSSDYSRSNSRYKDGRYSDSSKSRNGKDDGKYSDSSRYSKDSRSRDGREEGKYHERSREGREEGSRYRDGKEEGRYSESTSRHLESRYSSRDSWHSEQRYGDEESGGEETQDSAKAEQEKLKNVFQNDGSFLEMFKKLQEAAKASSEVAECSTAEPEAPVKQEAAPRPTPPAMLRRPVAASIVGKRRGGRVLPTGMVKKQKKEEEEVETPKDAWSLYMAEVRKYKEASCEEEGKTRPLVK